MVFAEEPYDTFEYYDADNDTYVTEYYFYGHGQNESFEYYDADNDRYCVEYYYYDEEAEETDETEDWYPDYSDLYQDEYQAAWYSPAKVFDWADFYSLEGEYICSIAPETWVQPLESIGTSGDITYISYDGYTGYIYTTLLLNPYGVTYDEIYQGGGTLVQLHTDANLRDENGDILTTIPAGYGVQFISYDELTGRCWVRWNGRVGTIIASAIWYDPDCYYADDTDADSDTVDYGCFYNECGYARITPSIGANVRDCDNNIVVAVPCGEEVVLLEPLNVGGRTLIKWGCYVGSVLTSCLNG
jgi:hypothetical protein